MMQATLRPDPVDAFNLNSPEGGPGCSGWCPACRERLRCRTYLEDFWSEIEKEGGPWWTLSPNQRIERDILLPVKKYRQ